MTSIKRPWRRFLVAGQLALMVVFLIGHSISFSKEKQVGKVTAAPAAKAISSVSNQKGSRCGKMATEVQLSAIAAKIREFQAKQQAKNSLNQTTVQEQVANR